MEGLVLVLVFTIGVCSASEPLVEDLTGELANNETLNIQGILSPTVDQSGDIPLNLPADQISWLGNPPTSDVFETTDQLINPDITLGGTNNFENHPDHLGRMINTQELSSLLSSFSTDNAPQALNIPSSIGTNNPQIYYPNSFYSTNYGSQGYLPQNIQYSPGVNFDAPQLSSNQFQGYYVPIDTSTPPIVGPNQFSYTFQPVQNYPNPSVVGSFPENYQYDYPINLPNYGATVDSPSPQGFALGDIPPQPAPLLNYQSQNEFPSVQSEIPIYEVQPTPSQPELLPPVDLTDPIVPDIPVELPQIPSDILETQENVPQNVPQPQPVQRGSSNAIAGPRTILTHLDRRRPHSKRCGDNEEYDKCGTACPATCSNAIEACTDQCVPGCFCKEGYVRNEARDCVLPQQCPGGCGDNAEFQFCGTACPATCSNTPEACTDQCVAGCFCQDGFVRNEAGDCVFPQQCPGACGDNAEYQSCGTACPATCTYTPTVCTAQCVSGCFCKTGFVRDDDTGACVDRKDCKVCPNRDEVYYSCGCEITCSNMLNPPTCTGECCAPGCFCKDDLVRNNEGQCVPPERCAEGGLSRCVAYCESKCTGSPCKATCSAMCNSVNLFL